MNVIDDYIRQHSKLEQFRDYVGMSSIGLCPLVIYRQFQEGVSLSDFSHRKSYQGYMYEREVKKILADTGLFRPGSEKELVAAFDSRYKGHTDGEAIDPGDMIEIKSMHPDAYAHVKEGNRLKRAHFWQVQTYLRHGKYNKANVYLVNTEVFEFHKLTIYPFRSVQDDADEKAKLVLRAIDAQLPPTCMCGRCK